MYLYKGKEDGEEPKRKDNDLNELQLKYITLKREGGRDGQGKFLSVTFNRR